MKGNGLSLITRGNNTLDLVLTNLHKFYKPKPAEVFPPFGLSDHKTIAIYPDVRPPKPSSRCSVLRRDTRPSRKRELGRYLNQIDWRFVNSAATCEEKNDLFTTIVSTGLDLLMPEKQVNLHCNDAPWVTKVFKNLINQRQRALASGNTTLFKFYRNKVNRARKSCRARYYASKVSHLKKSKPKEWWSEVKRMCGMSPVSGSCNLLSQLQVEDTDQLSPKDLANRINDTFLQPNNKRLQLPER